MHDYLKKITGKSLVRTLCVETYIEFVENIDRYRNMPFDAFALCYDNITNLPWENLIEIERPFYSVLGMFHFYAKVDGVMTCWEIDLEKDSDPYGYEETNIELALQIVDLIKQNQKCLSFFIKSVNYPCLKAEACDSRQT
jgi:hypothetical protein